MIFLLKKTGLSVSGALCALTDRKRFSTDVLCLTYSMLRRFQHEPQVAIECFYGIYWELTLSLKVNATVADYS